MEARDVLITMLEGTYQRALRCVEDMTEAEAARRPMSNLAPGVWQIGHTAVADGGAVVRFGGTPVLPANYPELFKGGTGQGDVAYPPLQEVRDVFTGAHRALVDLAMRKPLETPVEGQRNYKNLGEALAFLIYHRGYHVGKQTTLRALLGKPRLFG